MICRSCADKAGLLALRVAAITSGTAAFPGWRPVALCVLAVALSAYSYGVVAEFSPRFPNTLLLVGGCELNGSAQG